jgi:hypothetical protein
MTLRQRDPRDDGRPQVKEWQEFRAQFGAAFLNAWLADINAASIGQAIEKLQEATDGATFDAETAPDRDEPVAIFDPDGDLYFWPREEALFLYEQLFPHHDTPEEHRRLVLSLVIVGLYAAIESYAHALGLPTKGEWIPEAIERSVPRQALDSGTGRDLKELHATRNIIIHNRGEVDDRYINQVQSNRLQPGERKPISKDDLFRYARAVYRAASVLKDHVGSVG